MNAISPAENTTHDKSEARREIVRGCLKEIAVELGIRLRAAGLSHAVYLGVPRSRNAIASMVTLLDPSDEEWHRAETIVQHILSNRLGGLRLRNVELPCVIANDSIGAAEITAD